MSEKLLEFSTEDVVITEDGRVVINNPEFAKKLVNHAKKFAPGIAGIFDNCNCKDKEISEINLGKVLPERKFKLDLGVAGIFDNCNCSSKLHEMDSEVISR